MKKTILMLALLLAAFSSYSQAPITIVNNSSCDIWYRVTGGPNLCSGPYYHSQIFQLNAGNNAIYNDPTQVPGGMLDISNNALGVNGIFFEARIVRADPSWGCGGSAIVDDCGTPTNSLTILDNTCNSCTTVSINWTNGPGGATVTIN